MSDLKVTVLNALHRELGAKMVPFAGYDMPVQYPMGVMKEHLHCRAQAGLFDVSHMGQVVITAPGGYAEIAAAMEALVPVDVAGLADGRQRYAMFTNALGGIEDDFMIARRGEEMFVVVNASRKDADIPRMTKAMTGCTVTEVTDRALLALQGPEAETVLEALVPGAAAMRFMDIAVLPSEYGEVWLSRSGYTGEDGYEISVEEGRAEELARALLAHDAVEPIGLGARDSLRLEAGLCLYGNDIDAGTTPVEANLGWAIQKVRRAGGTRAGGFPGADVILPQLVSGAERRRVGLSPEGRAPMREGTPLFADETAETAIGTITSGAFGPSIEAPMSMGYVSTDLAAPGTTVYGEVRGKRLPAKVVALPFKPANFKR
ncbi:glycine cleavage system aminomethyltransferase GcvT [Pelagivirga sediminicola]|uniref:aminomethyltransferase n=1 Tax=Pelagivirga sediminicola TaxID=2170575 RepID=A0A2T7G677_9RHOB|nr:glycine cleavage system aminomethyltransferase GcvT [Pelagivirga sediminicola]PVA09920.1 glycine cleavage system aminomethyltransferase GcvT [Pelagivirga sediminicola]